MTQPARDWRSPGCDAGKKVQTRLIRVGDGILGRGGILKTIFSEQKRKARKSDTLRCKVESKLKKMSNQPAQEHFLLPAKILRSCTSLSRIQALEVVSSAA